jgi:hypothetical protein
MDYLVSKSVTWGLMCEQEENLFYQDLSESIIQDDLLLRLNSFPNVLITSHQAYLRRKPWRK